MGHDIFSCFSTSVANVAWRVGVDHLVEQQGDQRSGEEDRVGQEKCVGGVNICHVCAPVQHEEGTTCCVPTLITNNIIILINKKLYITLYI